MSAAPPPPQPSPDLEATLLFPELVGRLQQDLERDLASPTRRHFLLEGPTGGGKTHVLLALAERLVDTGWQVAALPEEHTRITRVDELLEAVLLAISEAPSIQGTPEEREDHALVLLQASPRPILVLAENLQELFERRLDRLQQARLRALLLRDPPFILLGSAPRPSRTWTSAKSPFYDFFQRRTLPPLTPRQSARLAGGPLGPERSLLQGLPWRVLVWRDHPGDAEARITALLAAMTPTLQQLLRELAPQAGRVLAECACQPVLVTPAQVARGCALPTNQVTAQIRKLQDRGLVRPGPRRDGRSRYVTVVDPGLRAWLAWREQWPDLPTRLAKAWAEGPEAAFPDAEGIFPPPWGPLQA